MYGFFVVLVYYMYYVRVWTSKHHLPTVLAIDGDFIIYIVSKVTTLLRLRTSNLTRTGTKTRLLA